MAAHINSNISNCAQLVFCFAYRENIAFLVWTMCFMQKVIWRILWQHPLPHWWQEKIALDPLYHAWVFLSGSLTLVQCAKSIYTIWARIIADNLVFSENASLLIPYINYQTAWQKKERHKITPRITGGIGASYGRNGILASSSITNPHSNDSVNFKSCPKFQFCISLLSWYTTKWVRSQPHWPAAQHWVQRALHNGGLPDSFPVVLKYCSTAFITLSGWWWSPGVKQYFPPYVFK